jgi:DedD protein
VDTSLKQRLIGAAILVALAVIFIPMLLDGSSRDRPVALDMGIPPEPKYTFEKPTEARPAIKPKPDAELPANRAGPAEIASPDSLPRKPVRKAPPAPKLTQVPEPEPVPERAPKLAEEPVRAPAAQPAQEAKPVTEDHAPSAQVAIADPPVEKPQAVIDTPESPPRTAALPEPGRVSKPREQAKPSPKSMLTAWAVQVGSFSEHENALSLRDKLRASGFAAFDEPARSDGERVFRVMVGPEFNRERAEGLQARLRRQENLKGIVVSHPPASDDEVLRDGG